MFEASVGEAQHHENLTIFPILAEADRDLPYLLMADAMATGVLTIRCPCSRPRTGRWIPSSSWMGSSSLERSRTG